MVTSVKFVPKEVCIVTRMYTFKGKKSSFFYNRSMRHSQWDSIEILGARPRKGGKVGGLALVAVAADWRQRTRSMRHRIFDASVTVLGAFFGTSPVVRHIFLALRGLILIG